MSSFSGVLKKGWHPEKKGTTFKGQINSVLGRNKDGDDKGDHVARPLSSLQDPTTFAPPPRRTAAGLEPVSRNHPNAASGLHGGDAEEVEPPAPKPYQMNTTNLRTDHLPAPPGRRDGADGNQPPTSIGARPVPKPKPQPSAKPSLPPRLPPRGTPSDSPTNNNTTPPASTGSAMLNQNSIDRLGRAGVSVKGFGIGQSNSETSKGATTNSQLSQVQGRFAKLSISSQQNNSNPVPTAANEPAAGGTTWAQKKAAFNTASQFQKDPSKVSFADAKAAASTANNFRQRHGEQVASGLQTANKVNQKYGVVDKVGGVAGKVQGNNQTGQSQEASQGTNMLAAASGMLGKKKPPPPPPPKKPFLPAANSTGPQEPPPIPTSTRPTF